MKKSSSLAQQIQQARKEFNTWTPERKASVRLEGSSGLSSRLPDNAVTSRHHKDVGHKR